MARLRRETGIHMKVHDMFPTVRTERVAELLELKEFKAWIALFTLAKRIREKKDAGEHVEELEILLKECYVPSLEALGEQIRNSGYLLIEHSAAHMVATGRLRI